jgi:hypothetical protein
MRDIVSETFESVEFDDYVRISASLTDLAGGLKWSLPPLK